MLSPRRAFPDNNIMSSASILGPGGAIARKLANYEPRPQQLEMADAVAAAMAGGHHLMVEAGTGVGKSFAYLVPAIQHALADPEGRVVISTHTISLQEQLVLKDIPFLQSVMPAFDAALVKGRGNYISLRRLRVANQKSGNLLENYTQQDNLNLVTRWAKATRDGSRSDLDFRLDYAVWELVESDSGNCLGRKCADYNNCFYFKARARMQKAKVLIVNHALFFCDLALRREGEFGILPKYSVAILDEGHTLEDVAAEHLGLGVSRGQVEYLMNRLYFARQTEARGLLTSGGSNEAMQQVIVVRDAADAFFQSIRDWFQEQPRKGRDEESAAAVGSVRVRAADIVADLLTGELEKLASLIARDAESLKTEELQIEFIAAANRCKDLAATTRDWLGQNLAEQVYWVDISGKRTTLASAPIDVGPLLRELLFDKVPSVIVTSATLSIGGHNGFEYFQKRLGFPEDDPTIQLGSPFDYRRQAELHLFPSMPDPRDTAAFERASLVKIRDYALLTGGRTFVLFTSNQAMARAANELRQWFQEKGIRLLCQSDGMPPARMLEEFKKSDKAVLFGVSSFWQGVDVQGDALRNVIITRLPFSPPTRPVVEARAEAIDNSGGQSFFDYQVPQAVIRLKQGFGRLIRTRQDTGMVVILDPRVATKAYGRSFLDALPECRRFVDGVEVTP